MQKKLSLVMLTGLLLCTSACESSRPKPGFVAKEWADNTRKLGITPIFPPRERVFPGDIYVTAIHPAKIVEDGPAQIYTVLPFRYDHLDLKNEFITEANDNRLMPSMPQYKNADTSSTPWAMPSHNVGTKRLNGLVAFPGFTFASLSESELGFNVTNGAWGALFGGGRKANTWSLIRFRQLNMSALS